MINQTTIRLHITRGQLFVAHARAYLAQRDPLALLAGLLAPLLVGIALTAAYYRSLPPTVLASDPVLIIATAPAALPPAPRASAALPTATPRLIVAYDQPNGNAFPDAIPIPSADQLVGRWGDDWIGVQWGVQIVWVRAADLGANLADARPVPDIRPAAMPAPAEPYTVANEFLPAPPADFTAEQIAAGDRQFGLTSADKDAALAAHQASEARSCDRDSDRGAYCQAVRQWMAAH
jgi:hypothetical protein